MLLVPRRVCYWMYNLGAKVDKVSTTFPHHLGGLRCHLETYPILHVVYIYLVYLHLADSYGKCKQIYQIYTIHGSCGYWSQTSKWDLSQNRAWISSNPYETTIQSYRILVSFSAHHYNSLTRIKEILRRFPCLTSIWGDRSRLERSLLKCPVLSTSWWNPMAFHCFKLMSFLHIMTMYLWTKHIKTGVFLTIFHPLKNIYG